MLNHDKLWLQAAARQELNEVVVGKSLGTAVTEAQGLHGLALYR